MILKGIREYGPALAERVGVSVKLVPPPQGKKKKKNKQGPDREDPFTRAAKVNLLAVILFQDHPYQPLTQADQERVKSLLVGRLDELAGEGTVPIFEGMRNRHGQLQVACSDQQSFVWLTTTIRQLTIAGVNTEEEQRLTCVPFGQEPRLVRAEVYLSGNPVHKDRFRRILGGQNKFLKTDRWVLKHEAKTPKGQLLVWGIDLDSVSALEAINFQPHFGLGRVTFRVSKDPPQEDM